MFQLNKFRLIGGRAFEFLDRIIVPAQKLNRKELFDKLHHCRKREEIKNGNLKTSLISYR